MIVLKEGEDENGVTYANKPLSLAPFQKFQLYNLEGIYYKESQRRKYKESFTMIPKKNGKTPFVSAYAIAKCYQTANGNANLLIGANTSKQVEQAFNFIKYNFKKKLDSLNIKMYDSQNQHKIKADFGSDGSFEILASTIHEDNLDGFQGNFVILDELHAYRSSVQYDMLKNATKSYYNSMTYGITSASERFSEFCRARTKYCQKILDGTAKDESYFVFINKADETIDGTVDYTNPIEHHKANPFYGKVIKPHDMEISANRAKLDPQTLQTFLAKELNIFTGYVKSYFNKNDFINSDMQYNYSLSELAKNKNITWYGGVDLSKLHDLTACCLCGRLNDQLIIIPHCFMPVTTAREKADKDGIPAFGWEADGFATLSNSPNINYNDVVEWFAKMQDLGFKIRKISYDANLSKDFVVLCKKKRMKIEVQSQYFAHTTKGFREIQYKAREKNLSYMHNEAFLYCVENVHAKDVGAKVEFGKVAEHKRIDIFACAVFAVTKMLDDLENESATNNNTRYLRSFKGGKIANG